MDKSRILIIGGAGFIGVNSARHFYQNGWDVTIFDNFSRRGTDLNIKLLTDECHAITVVKGDIRSDHDTLRSLADSHDVVLHLAAQVAVTTSVKDPREDFDINALGTFNVLEAVRQSNRKPIILFASTNKVYGGLEHLDVTEGETRYAFTGSLTGVNEATPLDFHSPYGCSKGAADQYVYDYARMYGLKTVVFRQSCIYGPSQFGIEDQGWVAWFIIAGVLGRPITVYGNGKQVRDLLFVGDLVQAYENAVTRIDTVAGKVYNVGGGAENSLSLLEFFSLLKNEFDLDLKYSSSDWRQGDQPIFVSDNTKVGNDLGWSPKIGVKEGIGQLLQWLKDHEFDVRSFYV